MKKLWFGATFLVVLLLAGGLYWLDSREHVLSEAPSRVLSNTPNYTAAESVLGIRVRIPFSVIDTQINQQLPQSFTGGGNGDDACKEFRVNYPWPARGSFLLKRVCVGTHYEFTATRTSPLTLSASGDKIHAAMGVGVEGKGGFRGDGADIVGVKWKKFRAAVNLTADIGLHLGSDWCPSADMATRFSWTQPAKVEIVDRVWVDVSGLVNDPLNKAIRGVSDKVKSAIPCDRIRTEIQKIWHVYDIPVNLPNGQIIHLVLNPTGISTSGVVVDKDEVRLALALKATTEVTTNPTVAAGKPLPSLGTTSDSPGHLQISLPVTAAYNVIDQEIMDTVGNKDIEVGDSSQKTTVRIKNVDVYPSSDRIVVHLTFLAKLPGRLFDVSGQIYATARPVMSSDGLKLGIADFGFSRILDNDLWSALSAVFEGPIKRAVEENSNVDLARNVADVEQKLKTAIADPAKTGGIKIDLNNISIKLETLQVGAQALTAVIDFSGSLDTTVTDLVSH